MNKILKNTKALKNEHFYLTNAFFCGIITEREIKNVTRKIKICTICIKTDISPDGEDTHTLRLGKRACRSSGGVCEVDSMSKLIEPHLPGSP